jgi:hypothetical protein
MSRNFGSRAWDWVRANERRLHQIADTSYEGS